MGMKSDQCCLCLNFEKDFKKNQGSGNITAAVEKQTTNLYVQDVSKICVNLISGRKHIEHGGEDSC